MLGFVCGGFVEEDIDLCCLPPVATVVSCLTLSWKCSCGLPSLLPGKQEKQEKQENLELSAKKTGKTKNTIGLSSFGVPLGTRGPKNLEKLVVF